MAKRKKPLDPNIVTIDGSQASPSSEKGNKKSANGRPRVPINAERVRILASYGLNVEQIASAEQVHPNTIYNNFGEAYRQGKLWGRGLLLQSIAANAIRHNNVQAQIFLAKNWLGYTDKGEMTVRHEHSIVSDRIDAMTHEERTRQMALLLERFPWLATGQKPPSLLEGQSQNPQGQSLSVESNQGFSPSPLVAETTGNDQETS